MRRSFHPTLIAVLALILSLCIGAVAQAQVRSETVRFPKGFTSTVLDDAIFGRETVDYTLTALAGQRFAVSLVSQNAGVAFDVFLPGSTTADFNGRVSGNSYGTRLRRAGDIVIRIQLDPQTARRGDSADFRLTLSVTGAAPPVIPPPQPTESALWQVSGLRGTDTLNMRSGPGTNFRVLDTFASGTVLRNLGCANTAQGSRWCEVSRTARGSPSGWVSSRYLVAVGRVPPGPVPNPVPTQTTKIKCSIILPILDRTCTATAVMEGPTVRLTLTAPGSGLERGIKARDGAFSSVERLGLVVQPLGAQYLMIVDTTEYYLVPSNLLQLQ